MQVLVIAVQNAVDYRDLGVATSGKTLFRWSVAHGHRDTGRRFRVPSHCESDAAESGRRRRGIGAEPERTDARASFRRGTRRLTRALSPHRSDPFFSLPPLSARWDSC